MDTGISSTAIDQPIPTETGIRTLKRECRLKCGICPESHSLELENGAPRNETRYLSFEVGDMLYIYCTNFAFGCIAVICICKRAFWFRKPYPLPPGPLGLPWFGSIIEINAATPWMTYAEWARKYGDLVYFRLFGKDIVVINSEKVAKDLLENRSGNYSDRPNFSIKELCGLGFNSALLPYGNRWRLHKRFFHQTFRVGEIPRFLPYQHRKACHLLQGLLEAPQQLSDHVFEYTASIILNSTYGYDPPSRKDELVDIGANLLTTVVPAFRSDIAIVVDTLPVLLRLPSWFPGMLFKRKLETARTFSKRYLDRPFEYSFRSMSSDIIVPSMVSDALRCAEERGVLPEESWAQALKEASGTAYMAASETSNSILMTFFLMIMLNPGVQAKAQAQIDEVVGKTRLPTTEDRPLLPLVDAIFWETVRFNPVVPLSIPRTASDDDVYHGLHIPKGAIILTNLWSMAHDESKYPNPHEFIPERFLNDDGSLKPNTTTNTTFGFGRRICVGRHFADTSVWSVIAKTLALFKILRPLDESGNEIPVGPRFSSGLTVRPLPFPCRIVSRFPGMDAEKLEELIGASGS